MIKRYVLVVSTVRISEVLKVNKDTELIERNNRGNDMWKENIEIKC